MLIDNLQEKIKADVYGNLIVNFILNSKEKTYSLYSRINKVRKSYYKNRKEIRYLMQKIRDIANFSNDYLEDKKMDGMPTMVDGKRVAFSNENFALLK